MRYFSLLVLCAFSVQALAQDAVIQRASSPPVIDGAGSDDVWASATAHGHDEFEALIGDSAPDGDDDMNITWKGLWDDDNLYLYVEVADDEIINDDSCDWQDDSVEFYIDAQDLDVEDYQFANNPGIPAYQITAIAYVACG